MKTLLTIVFTFLVPLSGYAAAAAVTPVYDNDSFRIGLTLPFVVESLKTKTAASISGLSIQAGNAASVAAVNKCFIAKDKFIRTNFLLKCDEPGQFKVVIDILEGNQVTVISYGPVTIAELKPGYTEPKPVEVLDPDIAAGRKIIFEKAETSGNRYTCVGCHSTPDTYSLRSKATATILKSLSTRSPMANVPNLTQAEAEKVLKYLKSIKDGAVWP